MPSNLRTKARPLLSSASADPDTRRLALILGLQLAIHHGRLGQYSLTPWEVYAAREAIARLEREIADGDVRQAA